MSDKRIGRQTPTVWSTLPYEKELSKGSDAVDMYELTGQPMMDWQKLQLEAILAVDKGGNYIHRRYGLSISRRNGKTEVFLARELYALRHGEKVLHTAHLTATSSDASRRLAECLVMAGYEEVVKKTRGEVYDHHFTYRKQFGMEVITLLCEGGGKVTFRTRTSRGGLGEKCDILIIDEAQEYLVEQENTLKFLVSDSKNRQILMCGTPPTAVSQGTVFKDFRNRVLDGKTKYDGWAEWSVPSKADVNNVDLWYETNPSLGIIFGEDAVELEIGSDDLDFNIQRLGLWIAYNLASAIKETEWRLTEVVKVPKLKGKTFAGIKYGTNGESVALTIACKTDDDKIFVSVYDNRPIRDGNTWIVDYLKTIPTLDKIVVDGKGNDAIISQMMRAEKLKKPVIPSGSDFCTANAQFEQAVFNDGLRHMPQPALDIAVTNCEKKKYGNRGAFIYVPNVDSIDITVMESTILAFWLCNNAKEQKGQRVSY
ncbi:MAG: hypothetical protein Q4A15_00475 [Prevotellaceae bacterium]|nr:hypothetical protein [Prevotellaceae bacterium]